MSFFVVLLVKKNIALLNRSQLPFAAVHRRRPTSPSRDGKAVVHGRNTILVLRQVTQPGITEVFYALLLGLDSRAASVSQPTGLGRFQTDSGLSTK